MFDVVYSSTVRRLFKDGCIEKIEIEEKAAYCLSDKGYAMSQTLINNTKIKNRTRIFDGIRLQIIKRQYY